MIVKLLTEHHLEFLSLKGGCTGSYGCVWNKVDLVPLACEDGCAWKEVDLVGAVKLV